MLLSWSPLGATRAESYQDLNPTRRHMECDTEERNCLRVGWGCGIYPSASITHCQRSPHRVLRTSHLQAAHGCQADFHGRWGGNAKAESKWSSAQWKSNAVRLYLCKACCHSSLTKSELSLLTFSLTGQIANILSFSGYIWSPSHIRGHFTNPLKNVKKKKNL